MDQISWPKNTLIVDWKGRSFSFRKESGEVGRVYFRVLRTKNDWFKYCCAMAIIQDFNTGDKESCEWRGVEGGLVGRILSRFGWHLDPGSREPYWKQQFRRGEKGNARLTSTQIVKPDGIVEYAPAEEVFCMIDGYVLGKPEAHANGGYRFWKIEFENTDEEYPRFKDAVLGLLDAAMSAQQQAMQPTEVPLYPQDLGEDGRNTQLVVMLDGLTLWRVHELVRGDPTDREMLIEHRADYLKALEDFAAAAMFSDCLGAPDPMHLGEGVEAKKSVEHLLFGIAKSDIKERIVRIPIGGQVNDLMTGEYRAYVEMDLRNMENTDWGWWVRHVQRDARKYLRQEEAVHDPSPAGSEYRHAKKGLVYDADLRGIINKDLFNECMAAATAAAADVNRRISPSDCEKFVYVVLVGHVVIGWRYFLACDAYRARTGNRDYLPSEGRASLILCSPRRHLGNVKKGLFRISRFLVPYCLEKALDHPMFRENLATSILDVADSDPGISRTRARIKEMRSDIEKGRYGAVDKLISEANAEASRENKSIAVENCVQCFDGIPQSGRWAQGFVKGTLSKVRRRVDSRLADLFPEVFKRGQ